MASDAAAFDDLHDGQATAWRSDPAARLEVLARAAGPLRRVVAALAGRLVACKGWKRLGYARPCDYARERLGCSARSLQDWARVDRSIAALPGLERALVEGTLTWSKVRLLARFVGPEDEAGWIAFAGSQPVRALERAVRAADRGALEAGEGRTHTPDITEDGEDCDATSAWVRIPASFAVAMQWQRVRKAAPRLAGERLPPGAVLEMVTAEVLSALPLSADATGPAASERALRAPDGIESVAACRSATERGAGAPHPSMSRAPAGRPDPPFGPCELPRFLRPLLAGLEPAGASPPTPNDPFEIDARLRRALRLEQRLWAEIGPLLRQVSAREYEWKPGCASLAGFARERLGMSARKLRALLRVERAGDLCPALRAAYRNGSLSWLQAQILARILARDTDGPWRERWVAFAQAVSVRRLEETVAEALALRETDPGAWARCRKRPEHIGEPVRSECATAPASTHAGERQVCASSGSATADDPRSVEGCRVEIAAPVEVARLFDATLSSVRLAIERETGHLPSKGQAFAAMLEHAARTWELDDPWLRRRKPAAVHIFERDGWRCTVPGCSSQRNLHAHHIEFRSQGGSDEDSNQTTLCAFHHLRGVHVGVITVRGRAPDALVYELGCRPGRPPLARFRSGDHLV